MLCASIKTQRSNASAVLLSADSFSEPSLAANSGTHVGGAGGGYPGDFELKDPLRFHDHRVIRQITMRRLRCIWLCYKSELPMAHGEAYQSLQIRC